MALHTGLVSVTFRKHTPREIVSFVTRAGLESIEWGGDIHVPPQNPLLAGDVRKLTVDSGLAVAAYGSYYRLGISDPSSFGAVLETAQALGAPTIRVWAGHKGSAEVSSDDRERIATDGRRIAQMASARGLTISFEFHENTLTDQPASAVRLFEQIDHPGIRSYWQTPLDQPVEVCESGLRLVLPWLSHVHVNCWRPGYTRCSLSEGDVAWKRYLDLIQTSPRDHTLMLEFVRDDAPEAFFEDAQKLKDWVRGYESR